MLVAVKSKKVLSSLRLNHSSQKINLRSINVQKLFLKTFEVNKYAQLCLNWGQKFFVMNR